jgi:hypothetical protein
MSANRTGNSDGQHRSERRKCARLNPTTARREDHEGLMQLMEVSQRLKQQADELLECIREVQQLTGFSGLTNFPTGTNH